MQQKLKPQDILVMIRLLLWEDDSWSIGKISDSIILSKAETHASINRCEVSGLYSPVTKKPIKAALEEFLLHGFKYSFPVIPGAISRGIPTAHSAAPISNFIESADNSEAYVWPYEKGDIRGISIAPLYKSVPEAALQDKKLYEFLALLDSLRVGKAREIEFAKKEILSRLK